MGQEDYAPVGGSLRLKGAGGIVKKKSKKKKRSSSAVPTSKEYSADPSVDSKQDFADNQLSEPTENNNTSKPGDTGSPANETKRSGDGKTEAERKFEETRKKRLDQKLLKEASKSHKERVEEFNKYLSNLSEHHDMPRIGPG